MKVLEKHDPFSNVFGQKRGNQTHERFVKGIVNDQTQNELKRLLQSLSRGDIAPVMQTLIASLDFSIPGLPGQDYTLPLLIQTLYENALDTLTDIMLEDPDNQFATKNMLHEFRIRTKDQRTNRLLYSSNVIHINATPLSGERTPYCSHDGASDLWGYALRGDWHNPDRTRCEQCERLANSKALAELDEYEELDEKAPAATISRSQTRILSDTTRKGISERLPGCLEMEDGEVEAIFRHSGFCYQMAVNNYISNQLYSLGENAVLNGFFSGASFRNSTYLVLLENANNHGYQFVTDAFDESDWQRLVSEVRPSHLPQSWQTSTNSESAATQFIAGAQDRIEARPYGNNSMCSPELRAKLGIVGNKLGK